MMHDLTVNQLIADLPTPWVRTYIRTFESGRVQKRPQTRFVNARSECCLVAALMGAETAGDVVRSEAWAQFRGSVLEELSRRFESRCLTGQEFYEECVLAIAARSAEAIERPALTAVTSAQDAVTLRMRGR
jgi:hypothetical protein